MNYTHSRACELKVDPQDVELQFAYLKRFPNCRFGNDGSFWKMKNGQWGEIKQKTPTKYRRVVIQGQSYALHRLIAEAFYGKRSDHVFMVRHLDDDPTNNALWNLAWGTSFDNAIDASFNGRLKDRKTRWD